VSAIASFTVLFLLMSVGELWQQYDVVRDITWLLSIKDRTERMSRGLINSKDLIYYLVIIYMFVSFTILHLNAGRERRAWYIGVGRYMVVIVCGLLVGYIGSRPRFTGYWDTTAIQSNTLHYKTRDILKELGDSTLEVTLYTNLLSKDAAAGLPAARNAWLDQWEPYIRVKPDIDFKYEYFYAVAPGDSSYYKTFPHKTIKQIAGLVAKGLQVDSAMFKSPEQISSAIDLTIPENYSMFMRLRYMGRSTILRIFPGATGLDLQNGSSEPHFIAALNRLLGKPMPKIAFVSGELERSIYKWGEREYYGHTMSLAAKANALITLGFDVDTLNLATTEVPPDVSVLVLADPKRELSPVVSGKLRNYIDQGRNLLIFGEPGKQYVLNPLLRHVGVQLVNGQLVQPREDETPDKIIPYWTQTYIHLAEEPGFMFWRRWFGTRLKPDTMAGSLQGAAGISYSGDSGFVAKPLLLTLTDKAWSKMGKLVTDSTPPVFSPDQGDLKIPSFSVALQLTRQKQGKEQRVVVYGDADVASNLRLQADLVRSVYSWLVYNRFPVYTRTVDAKDNIIILGERRAAVQKIIYVWVLPGVLLVVAMVLLIRRKRQ
jgi:ABC-2 type transport system permease protein